MAVIKSITILILTFLATSQSALYEDQVGKFDWKKSYIGKVTRANLQGRRLVVATEENVVAALNIKNGNILWRQILEDPKEHSVKLLGDTYTVSGGSTSWTWRSWDAATGNLVNEFNFAGDRPLPYEFEVLDNKLYVVGREEEKLSVRKYHTERGISIGESSVPFVKTPAGAQCVLVKLVYVCVVGNNLHYVSIVETSNNGVVPLEGTNLVLKPFEDDFPAVLIESSAIQAQIYQLKNGKFIANSLVVMPDAIGLKNNDKVVEFHLESTGSPLNILIKSTALSDQDALSREFEYPQGLGKPHIIAGNCLENCNLLMTTTDDALLLVKFPEGKVQWTREEALSRIVATEFVELPVSELDASIENEFNANNIVEMFLKRISTQAKQLGNIFGSQLLSKSGLVRDDFGLHKFIVVATKCGKIFGIDTLTGSIAWTYRLPNVRPFKALDSESMLLYTQRSTRYAPLPAQCILFGEDTVTGNGVYIQFNPINGISEESIVRLGYKIKQATLLPTEDKDHVKPVVVFSDDEQVHVYPSTSKDIIGDSTYLYVVDGRKNELKGFKIETQKAVQVWSMALKPSTIVGLSARPSGERVHSQGRVLADRSVHYKYVNPNLLALATLSDDPVHKSVLSIYLIDGITGFVVYATSHKRAKGPVHLVHSENWIVYSYFSERYRRTEVVSAELYEGPTQSNSTVFSSLAVSQLTQVLTQSYILPAFPLTVAVSRTERGITNKFLFFALNGGVAEIPWLLLQPRFADAQCLPDEQCIPYMPEIPLPPEAYINYNQTLGRVRGIAVAPAKLESTSHVLVYGLDLFYTRVAPSKTFDLLKEDFDHVLIVLVLVGLVVASFITKYFAGQKVLKQAWK